MTGISASRHGALLRAACTRKRVQVGVAVIVLSMS
jgi:hypothetical protein